MEIIAVNIGVNDSIDKSKDYKFEHDLPYDIINYVEKIDSKNGIITITKKK